MNTCWLCGQPINDPPLVIGHYVVDERRVSHRHCLRTLGEHELELQLPPDPGEPT